MLGLGNALNKVKSLVPKVVNAGNKAVKTAVKKVADSALGRAVSSIPSTVRAGAAKVGQITRKAVAAIPKIIEPVKKKAVEKAVQIKNTVTAKAVQIKSAVNTAIGQANQAIVNKSNQVIKTVGQIQNAVEKNVNEFNTVTEQKNKRIVEKLKVEWANTSSDLIRGVILAGAFPNYLPIRSSSLLLDFMLKYRRSVIEEYPILEFPVPVLRGPLNFIRNEITNKGAAAGSFIYKQKIPGLSDFVGELTDQRGPGAESNAFSVVGAGVRGVVVKGALGMVDGFASLIDDPVTALEGLNSIVAHPDETIPVMCEGAKTFWNEKVVNGSPEDRAEVVGQAVFEVATWLVGVGEAKTGATLGKTAKVARGTETIEDLSKANKVLKSYRFADGVDAATDTLKIAKSAETVIGKTTSKINKSWLKNLGKTAAKNLDDAIIKTSKKTGDFIDNIRWGMKQHSNGPKLAFETVGNIDSLSSTGDMIADYFSRIKKIVKNKLDSTGNHNVNIKPKVDAEDVSKSIKKSGTGPGTFAEGAGKSFKQGDSIPKNVLDTKPKNSPNPEKWLNNGGKVEIENDVWKYTNKDGVTVKYNNGYPNFKEAGQVKQEVDIGGFKDYRTDFELADELAPNGPRDSINNTWHHNEDGKTLQEVDKFIHKEFTHRGGMSIKKSN